MATKTRPNKKPMTKPKTTTKPVAKAKPVVAAVIEKPVSMAVSPLAAKPKESAKEREERERRRDALQQMLMRKRQEILKEIEGTLGQSLTEDQQRRLESARDVGDQALMDLDRELGISLMEMRNRRRQAIDEAPRFTLEAGGWTWMARVAPRRYQWTRLCWHDAHASARPSVPQPLATLRAEAPTRVGTAAGPAGVACRSRSHPASGPIAAVVSAATSAIASVAILQRAASRRVLVPGEPAATDR